MSLKIPFLDLGRVGDRWLQEINAAIGEVVSSGIYINGSTVERFEKDYAAYIGTEHAVGVGNGLDALTLIFRAYKELGTLNDGDEVIVPANTYIASILAVTENKLVPRLVEPSLASFNIDAAAISKAITKKTRAVLLVHLYGRNAFTPEIDDLCNKNGLLLIEDNAQAHGCHAGCRRTGSLGHAAAHSFYPTKNLGALGDGGAVTTSSAALADIVRALANYGTEKKYINKYMGRNSRLDAIQAAILTVKLKHLDENNERRKHIAFQYLSRIDNNGLILPSPGGENVWHIFPVLTSRRESLRNYLAQCGVETMVHYPIPPHKQHCYRFMNNLSFPVTERIHNEEVSLPLYPELEESEITFIVDSINSWEA